VGGGADEMPLGVWAEAPHAAMRGKQARSESSTGRKSIEADLFWIIFIFDPARRDAFSGVHPVPHGMRFPFEESVLSASILPDVALSAHEEQQSRCNLVVLQFCPAAVPRSALA
jgi:hypothetical protein